MDASSALQMLETCLGVCALACTQLHVACAVQPRSEIKQPQLRAQDRAGCSRPTRQARGSPSFPPGDPTSGWMARQGRAAGPSGSTPASLGASCSNSCGTLSPLRARTSNSGDPSPHDPTPLLLHTLFTSPSGGFRDPSPSNAVVC